MLELDDVDRAELIEDDNTVFFPSKFKFLMTHNGFRPGEMHMLLSTAGSGKTTLMKSIMFDMSKDTKILYFLSEETETTFKKHVAKQGISNALIKNITVVSELEAPECQDRVGLPIIKHLEKEILRVKPDLVIYDNITTSAAYADLKPDVQTAVVRRMKVFAAKHDVPFLLVAHTRGDINIYNQGLLCGNHIRGNKGIINFIEYLYIFQKLSIADNYFNFINIEKHRSQAIEGKFFALEYSVKQNAFAQDWPISFEILKENYGQRNIL